ncbi:MAG: SPOR domain-containing protein [Deltaproteobacteria bacterium]
MTSSLEEASMRRRPRADVVAFTMGRGRFRLLVGGVFVLVGAAFAGGLLLGQNTAKPGVMAVSAVDAPEEREPTRRAAPAAPKMELARVGGERDPAEVKGAAPTAARDEAAARGDAAARGNASARGDDAARGNAPARGDDAARGNAAARDDDAAPGADARARGDDAAPADVQIRDDVPDDGFGLQLGAFESREEAVAFIREHGAALGDRRVHVIATEVKGKGTWHRVRVGHFDSKRIARRARRNMTDELRSTSIVVKYR